MSIWSSAVDVAVSVAADAAGTLPSSSAGTLATQTRIFGFGATTIGAEAEAAAHGQSPYVALAAVLVGVAAVALLPEVAIATATGTVVHATLPILGGVISEAALTSIVGGVLEVGVAGIATSIAEPIITDFLDILNDYGWALNNPDAVLGELPDWLFPVAAVQSMAASYAVGGGGGNTGGISCPLVLDLDGDGVETSKLGWGAAGSHTYFDMDNDGFAERTAWAGGGDGLLAIDRNGNGIIDDKSELFGNTEIHADGFAALRALDTNADNVITAADADFSNLRVWIDADSDGVTDAGELRTLGSLGITRIDLNATELGGVLNNENAVSDRSTFTMNGATRTVEDVWFRMDQTDTRWTGDVALDVRTLFLPTLRGFGQLPDLHIAMSLDPDLLTLVQNFATGWSNARFVEYNSVLDDVRAILYKWAGVEDVPVEDPRIPGTNLDGRDIAFVEKLTGIPNVFIDSLQPGVPMGIVPTYVSIGINTAVNKLAAALIFQSGGAEMFEDGHYDLAAGDIVPGMVDGAEISNLIAQAPPMSGYNNDWSDYWRGITTFLVTSKTLDGFTPDELAVFDGWSPQNQSWFTYAQSIDNTLFFGITATGTDFSDQITGTSDRDFLSGGDGDDLIQGHGGTDFINGGDGNDALYGGADDDLLTDDGGDDLFVGGPGDDRMRDTGGNDTYIYNPGDGHDVTTDVSSNGWTTDVIRFGEGIAKSSVTLERVDYWRSLRISVDGSPAIDVYEFFRESGLYGDYRIERLEFSDGSVMDLNVYQDVLGTNGDDVLNGLDRSLLKADHVIGKDGNDTISGGAGNDWLEGGDGNDTLTGGSGDDLIEGGTGDDSLRGSAGNDRLLGGSGSDTYHYSSGDGLDTIYDAGANEDGNVIRFGSGFTAGGMQLVRVGQSDLALESGGMRNILIEAQFYNGDAIKTVQFNDGTSIDLTTVSYRLNGTDAGEYLVGTNRISGPDIIYGYGGNDTIYGLAGNDYLIGGDGDDILNGGYGDDRYTYESGIDTIIDNGGNDRIDLAAGITLADLSWARNGNYGLNLSINGSLAIRMDGQFSHQDSGIERIRFNDGSYFYLSSLQFTTNGTSGNDTLYGISYGANPDDTINGLGGNDTILGGLGNDTINGGAGNDTLYGDAGDDVYLVNAGEGVDTISDSAGNDKIIFGAGLSASNMTMTRDGTNLNIAFGGVLTTVVQSHFSYNATSQIETLQFSDASTLNILNTTFTQTGTSASESLYGYAGKDRLVGNDGNDSLSGYGGNDRLEGGFGNDTLYGGTGNDTYVFGIGDGSDTLSEYLNEGADTVLLGFTQSQIRSWTDNNYLYLQSASNPADVLKISGAMSYTPGNYGLDIGQRVENISFSDGTSWNLTTGLTINDTDESHYSLYGSALSDTMDGNGGNDQIYGHDGNDLLYGGNGTDSLYGGTGDDRIYAENDNDTVYGDEGNDWLRGGSGNDTLYGGAGNDGLVGDAGVDILYGGTGADKFVFYPDTTFDAIDTIKDFSLAEGDRLFVRDLLIDFDPLTKLITDFVQITENGSSSTLSVDRDGTGGAYAMAQIATIQGVTGLTDEAALLANGTLVAV
ncbi:MAG: type I secretion C-terminal target domain-containing protein [Rhodospirillales bacterium]|nr:type I secretion C-terminal target domain-containing protein [Rhodospirillales bacterium]